MVNKDFFFTQQYFQKTYENMQTIVERSYCICCDRSRSAVLKGEALIGEKALELG